jgi:chromosome segregation ATPase
VNAANSTQHELARLDSKAKEALSTAMLQQQTKQQQSFKIEHMKTQIQDQ